MRPIVGITSYAQEASWAQWTLPAALVPLAYVQSVEVAGGRPLLVPPTEDALDETLAVLDALVLSGGADIDPSAYGQAPHPETSGAHPHRDAAELALLETALAREMPVLAICRGMQMLNILYGGNLDQHLPETLGHTGHRETHGVFSEHRVRLKPGSRAADILGVEASVKSSHHQGIDRVGAGLEAVGWAEDGSVEAIENGGHRFVVGVLWHPEEDEDKALFAALVEEARRYGGARRE